MQDLIARGIDVRWATTWQEHANTYFADILGIPPLPVAVSGSGPYGWTSGEWKATALARQFDGRPLLWVDDNPGRGAHLLDQNRRPIDRALTHTHHVVNYINGMTPNDATAMDEWITLASTPEGHQELRQRRRTNRTRRQRVR